MDWFPAGVIEIGSKPFAFQADVVLVVPVHDVVAIGRSVGVGQALQFGERKIEVVAHGAKRSSAGPGFSGGSADGIDHQTDGNVGFLLNLAGKVESDGRDPLRCLRRYDLPRPSDEAGGVIGGTAGHREVTNLGIVG